MNFVKELKYVTYPVTTVLLLTFFVACGEADQRLIAATEVTDGATEASELTSANLPTLKPDDYRSREEVAPSMRNASQNMDEGQRSY